VSIYTLEVEIIDAEGVCGGREGIVLVQLVVTAQETFEGRHGCRCLGGER
jgi:hypothetical protein